MMPITTKHEAVTLASFGPAQSTNGPYTNPAGSCSAQTPQKNKKESFFSWDAHLSPPAAATHGWHMGCKRAMLVQQEKFGGQILVQMSPYLKNKICSKCLYELTLTSVCADIFKGGKRLSACSLYLDLQRCILYCMLPVDVVCWQLLPTRR